MGHLRPFTASSAIGCRAPIPAVAPMTIVPSRSAHSGHSPIIPSENNMVARADHGMIGSLGPDEARE